MEMLESRRNATRFLTIMSVAPRPDYRVRATIISGPLEVEGVLCELRLPKRVRDPVHVKLIPTDAEQFGKVTSDFKFGLRYAADNLRIDVSTVYIEHAGGSHWAADVEEHELRGIAADLTVTVEGEYASDQQVVFALTPNVTRAVRPPLQRGHVGLTPSRRRRLLP